VVSAVGHEVDVTIADHVADRRALTPTEAATLVTPDRQELRQYLARAGERLTAGLRHQARTARAQLAGLAARRALARPHERLHELTRRVDELDARLRRGLRNRLDQLQARLAAQSATLHALSPLQVLARGYSVTRIADGGPVVHEPAQAPIGTRLETRLTRGRLISRVEEQHDQ
jgi:exodeoxyribonuclease VII large subunit